jgi:hypothetical protein
MPLFCFGAEETPATSSNVVRAKPSMDDAAFGMTRMTMLAVSGISPTWTTTTTTTRHSQPKDIEQSSNSVLAPKQKAKSPAKQRLSINRDLRYKSLRLSVSFGVAERDNSRKAVARAKPSIHDAAFWDDR